MLRFLVDEDLPRSLAIRLRAAAMVAALGTLPDAVGLGNLIIVEPGGIRLRRPG
jgi:hypothetical protein